MDMQALATQVADAVAAAPALAQELVSDPAGAVEKITGERGADVTALLPKTLALLAERSVDLSAVDLGKLNVDLSKLDMAAIAGKLLGGGAGALGGLLGGLFGRR